MFKTKEAVQKNMFQASFKDSTVRRVRCADFYKMQEHKRMQEHKVEHTHSSQRQAMRNNSCLEAIA
ncbi:hypothetical protein [Leptolyngbya sp. FACHB-711]|uniref:hypothetical protein n=1 Tax=unclassified Leptolyngbya TaxID=2650499 RepID=UPI00168952A7|nr:hypothetical protein [Leptolyngbya sp. FACHB-711]MBD1849417.1 hypothetical protein [Cyanobacteria bacterium FACHB-502]MBD2024115.1 hypothetical protein [Leptolyngbya sp. FACHB-711]